MLFGMWKHLYRIVNILFTSLALKKTIDSTFLFTGSKCLKGLHARLSTECRFPPPGNGSTTSGDVVLLDERLHHFRVT